MGHETSELRVIAIDGPAGAGKSTIGRALAGRLGLSYLDTGAMFRAVTVAALRRGLDTTDLAAVADLVHRISIDVGDPVVTVDGDDVTEAIRTPEVNAAVSAVAANVDVREELRRQQQAWAGERGGGVIEGRDIGTVVFPDALLKLYLTASPEVRAARRHQEQSAQELADVAAAIARRDHLDRSRSHAPLAEAADAVLVDTGDRPVAAIVDELAALVAERQRARGA
jgi:CMP/dCMP kinase